jgi:hypothetical protein
MSALPKTLHEAIKLVLTRQPQHTASTFYISKEIARRKLWAWPLDGSFPEPFQIKLRVKSKRYRHLFEMLDEQTVHLKSTARNSGESEH